MRERNSEVLGKQKEVETIRDLVEEMKGIEKGLTQIMDDLREKIERLKKERVELLEEIEEYKKTGETKANTLKKEIVLLRKEVESLKQILDDNE